MMEGQAYIVALILMIASPLAIASDEGQAVLERFDRTPDDQVYDVANNRIDMLDELDDSPVAPGAGWLQEALSRSRLLIALASQDWSVGDSDHSDSGRPLRGLGR